jgi:UDP-N-acetylmuramoyl-tripeptide--D-alanyl-D-alanine ligase
MLDTLDQFENRKVAVLGDMRELGSQAEIEHKKAAQKAVRVADKIILVGPLMKNYFLPEAKKQGFPEEKITSFLSPYKAANFVKKNIQKKDVVLIKGSQNTIFLEIVVKKLMANPEEAESLLCRQSDFWKRKKQELIA